MSQNMYEFLDELQVKMEKIYGSELAAGARSHWYELNSYNENLQVSQYFEGSPKKFIETFIRVGRIVYDQDEFYWILAWLLTTRYWKRYDAMYLYWGDDPEYISPRFNGKYCPIEPNWSDWIDAYLDLKDSGLRSEYKIKMVLVINKDNDMDHFEEWFEVTINASTPSMEPGSIEEAYQLSREIYVITAIDWEVFHNYERPDEFIRRVSSIFWKRNFKLSMMLRAQALCSEYQTYGYDTYKFAEYFGTREEVIFRYNRYLKDSRHRKERGAVAYFLYNTFCDEEQWLRAWR